MKSVQPLEPEQLRTRFDPDHFQFESTAELKDKHEIIGQERALKSIEFGIGIQRTGYNLFALGPVGTGKYTTIRRFLDRVAPQQETPNDWCYVYNFDHPHIPRALSLPAGQAILLNQDMKKLVVELLTILPSAFSSDEYLAQRKTLEEEYKSQQTQALEDLRKQAKLSNIAFIQTPGGFAFAPLKDGEVVSPDDFLNYSADKQKAIEEQITQLQEILQNIMRQVPHWQREAQKKLKKLNHDVAAFTIAPLFDELTKKYQDFGGVIDHIDEVRNDIIENVDAFLDSDQPSSPEMMGIASTQSRTATMRYQVNVMVDHSDSTGAPIIYEDQPRYQNLVGRVEHVSQMGTLVTDFTLIKAGALHRANGGYLVLDARKLLLQPYAWEGLKNALLSKQIYIESMAQIYSSISTVSLEPEPIPLDIKVLLVGDRRLYYLLSQLDPEFAELFKVSADFEDDMERNMDTCLAFARLIGALARKEDLRHFDKEAVGRIIEHSSRTAGDARKLSVHMQSMSDLMRESDYWAAQEERDIVTIADVQQALDSQIYRSSRLRDRIQESIIRHSILIDTEGSKVGQINGLAVFDMGQFAFGKPSRITARVRMGKGEVIDIERQVEMGGPIHSKGVMILAGFLGARYAAERPLSLSATLVFEQSYGGVEGDSASAAELFALLSSLSELPISQSLAVTGSINQLGEIQAIGGVNEKIEGFFDLCKARGLTGNHGVIIPKSNVTNLMLRQDVVDAVDNGQFNVFAIADIDQGMEILTGMPAGNLDKDGQFPMESINGLVIAKLDLLAERQRHFSASSNALSNQNEEENGEAAAE